LPARIEQLKANVKAQETKLEEGMRMLNAVKKKEQHSKGPTTSSYTQQGSQPAEWDALERVIRIMDDLLISYRKYSAELEKRVTKLDAKVGSSKSQK
jgi:hypothetical protein